MSCTATGAPLEEFIFRHNGQILPSGQSNINISVIEETSGSQQISIALLTICPVTSQHSGNYSCTAQNGLANDSADFALDVSTTPGIMNSNE